MNCTKRKSDLKKFRPLFLFRSEINFQLATIRKTTYMYEKYGFPHIYIFFTALQKKIDEIDRIISMLVFIL